MNLQGKIAVVTGGSRGIGKSISQKLAECGASVAVNYVKDDESAEATVMQIKESGGYAVAIKRDISNYSEAGLLFDEVVNTFGRIDILVNNAGISKVGLFIDLTEDDWDNIMSINLKGIFNTSHNAVKYMIGRKSGCIINISSIWGNAGAACEVAYSATKGGINTFTKALAKELAPSNIRVNAIAPGVIETEMNAWLSSDEKKYLMQEIPMGIFGKGEDIGAVAAFLCSDEARYITGQVITVDGGFL